MLTDRITLAGVVADLGREVLWSFGILVLAYEISGVLI